MTRALGKTHTERHGSPGKVWGWTPLFGLGWLAFFWALFQLHALLP
jgi:hypothetical protein